MTENQKNLILVTGSSGFIGTSIIKKLSPFYRIVGLDQMGPPMSPPEAECICVDIKSDASLKGAMERIRYAYGDRIASVIHLAAYYDFSGEPSSLYEEITVRGTERLLRELQDFQVEQFIFSSTILVYAPSKPGIKINEDSPLEPKWDYPESKMKTEKLLLEKRGAISSVILRIAGVYDDECHSIPLAHQIQRINENQITRKLFPGDISHGQSFVHLDDLTEAIVRTVEKRNDLPPESIFLIGEPETLSYDRLQKLLSKLIHNEEWETIIIPKAMAKTGAWVQEHAPIEDPFIKPWMIDLADDHYELDISRARTLLGWEPKHTLGETIPKMVDALKRDQALFYRKNKLNSKEA